MELASPALCDPHALERAFAFLSFNERLLNLPLVCQGFNAILRRGGLHWQDITLDGHNLAPAFGGSSEVFWAKVLEWLKPRGGSVRRLCIQHLRVPFLPTTTRQAAMLQNLFGMLPGLQQLDITHDMGAMSPEMLRAVTCLTALKRFKAKLQGPLPTTHINALSSLPLESLTISLVRTLDGNSTFKGPFPAELTRLRNLERLVLWGPYAKNDENCCEVPEGIVNWNNMTHLSLVNMGLRALPEVIGELVGLEELCLGRNQLGPPHAVLPDSMTQLTRLRRLELQHNGFEAGLPPIIGHLTTLEELNLSGNLFGLAFANLPREFSQLRRLQYLTLTNCGLATLPSVLTGMDCLKLLKVNINHLQDLPGGKYLDSLETLDIAHNTFAGYPAVLATAKRLQAVSFKHNGMHYTDPAIAAQLAAAPAPAIPMAAVAAGAMAPVGAGAGGALADPLPTI